MTENMRRTGLLILLGLIAAGCAHGTEPRSSGPQSEAAQTERCAESDLEAYDSLPRVTNSDEVGREMERHYRSIVTGGFSGTARVCLDLDEEGAIQSLHLAERTGVPGIDAAAIEVAEMMRFTPANRDGEPASITVMVPLTFTARRTSRSARDRYVLRTPTDSTA